MAETKAKAKAEKQTVAEPKASTVFTLPKKMVKVKPLIKATAMIPDINHRAAFLAPNAKYRMCLPVLRNGTYKNPLTNEEKEFFENSEWGLGYGKNSLSVLKREDNFWDSFEFYIGKEVFILDLENPEDYLKYKVLLACSDIVAKSVKDVKVKPRATYKFYLETEEELINDKVETTDIIKQAWAEFFKIENDREKMIKTLTVFGRNPAKNSTDKFLSSELSDIIQESKSGARDFLAVVTDPNFELKYTIRKGIRTGALIKRNGMFLTSDGETLGRTEEQCVEFLSQPVNQELLIKIESKVSN